MPIKNWQGWDAGINSVDFSAQGKWMPLTPATEITTSLLARNPGGRAMQRCIPTTTQLAPFPWSTTARSVLYTDDLGSVDDFYAAGGFSVQFYAACLYSPVSAFIGTDGTFILGRVANSVYSTSDMAIWASGPTTGSPVYASVNNLKYANGIWFGAATPYYTIYTNASSVWNFASQSGLGSAIGDVEYNAGASTYWSGWYTSSNTIVLYASATINGSYTAQATISGLTSGSVKRIHNITGTSNMVSVGVASTSTTTNRGFIYFNASSQLAPTAGTDNTGLNDVADNAVNRTVIVGDAGTIYSSTILSGAYTKRTSNTTVNLKTVVWTGTEFVAMADTGASVYSTDGGTWAVSTYPTDATMLNPTLLKVQGETYAVSRPTATTGIHHTWKYLGSGNWQKVRALTVYANTTANLTTVPAGIFFGDTSTPGAAIANGQYMAGFNYASGATYSAIPTSQTAVGAGSAALSTPINTWSKCQILATAVPGQSTPTFTLDFYVNEIVITSGVVVSASSGQRVYWTTPASFGGFNVFDDFVCYSGAHRVAGDYRIVRNLPTSDAGSPQWNKVPAGASSNIAAAIGDGTSTSASSVQSSAIGDTDTYQNASFSVPSGYRVEGIKASAFLQRLGAAAPTAHIGLVSSAEQSGPDVVLNGTVGANVYTEILVHTDSNGSLWTAAGVTSAKVTLKRTA